MGTPCGSHVHIVQRALDYLGALPFPSFHFLSFPFRALPFSIHARKVDNAGTYHHGIRVHGYPLSRFTIFYCRAPSVWKEKKKSDFGDRYTWAPSVDSEIDLLRCALEHIRGTWTMHEYSPANWYLDLWVLICSCRQPTLVVGIDGGVAFEDTGAQQVVLDVIDEASRCETFDPLDDTSDVQTSRVAGGALETWVVWYPSERNGHPVAIL